MKRYGSIFALFLMFFAVSCDNGLKFNNPNDKNSEMSQSDDADAENPTGERPDGDQNDSGPSEPDDDAETQSGRNQGELYGECYPNKTCNEGLKCDEMNNICIKNPGDSGDSDSSKPDDDAETQSGRNQGELYGECYPNKTCNEGLKCDEENNICIKNPGDSGDSTSDGDSGDSQPNEEVDSESVPDETQDEEANETPEPDEEEPQTSGCSAGFVQLTDGSCKPDCEHGTYNCPLNKRCAYDTTTNEPGCFACAEGYYGNDCMSCDINTFCSAHANICVFNSNNSSNTCTCLEGYTGATCGTCVEGYVNTAAAGEPLNCKKNCELCYDGIEYLDFMGSGLPIPMEAHGQCDYETQTCVCLDGWTTSSAVIVGMAPYCSVDPNASSGE